MKIAIRLRLSRRRDDEGVRNTKKIITANGMIRISSEHL